MNWPVHSTIARGSLSVGSGIASRPTHLSGAGAIAYFGRYALDEAAGVLSLHVDASNRAGAAGRDQKRLVQLDGDALTLRNHHVSHSLGGVTLVWKRAG